MYYVGIDHHKLSNHITVMDQDGNHIKQAVLPNRGERFKKFFSDIPGPCSVVFEASRDWSILYEDLEPIVADIHMANPYKLRLIAEAKVKTDKIDSEILANLLRGNLIPEAHIPSTPVRHIRNLLRQRLFFVRLRTMVKNRVHNLLDRNHLGETVASSFSDLFGKKGMAFVKEVELPRSERTLLDELINLLEELNQLITEDDRRIKELFHQDQRVALVATTPGLGYLLSALVVYEIDDIERFPSPKKLVAYAGLAPSTRSSADRCFHGRLIKSRNRYLSWAMVEAVYPAIRQDQGLYRYFNRIRRKTGPNAAKVATARFLMNIVYRILKDRRPFWPSTELKKHNPRAALAAH